ncbi:hypothetical protein VNI00_001653 [Paramarasmius palmivorus]|uniref:Cobalamin-independent methionine synthase MetE C-terminal/archaeal domain-containing protein n=1 Tax=Paramarasmius palmivorus TaxID=297713 RepID=A0AAW0E4N4_9AGAR
MTSSSTLHLRPPFRAEHVGSLLRTQPLYEKRALLEEGKCSREDLKQVEDEAVKHVVTLQRELGIKTITDGEMRRDQFYDGVFDNLEGMVFLPERPITEFKVTGLSIYLLTLFKHTDQRYIPFIGFMYASGVPHFPTYYCNGRIKRTKPFYVDQFKYTRSVVSPEEVPHIKINVCAPSWFHQRHGSDLTYDLNVYKNDEEYFADLGVAYRAEFQELYDLGCRHIQIDDPTFAFFCHDPTIAAMKEHGVDPRALLDTYIRAINICTQGRPKDLTISLHICRGNFKGLHFCEGGYDFIAEKVFNGLDVDALYLEFDDARSGDFAPLKHIPRNKTVVLGLVTTKNPQLETVDTVKTRVEEAVAVMSQDGSRTREEALNQSNAFSFSHGNPTQCDDLTLTWSGGSPPYTVLLTPVFGTPRNISIPSSSVNNGQGSFSTQLPIAQGEKFLVTMSDATGFGSGGTTELLTVGSSKGGSCNTTEPDVAFSYQLNSALQQCRTFTFSDYSGAIQPVTIIVMHISFGLIPGGQSVVLQPPRGTTSFDWTTNVWNGTSMVFVMADGQFRQGGSSDVRIVGASDDRSCIDSNSPSSTFVPTATSTGTNPTSTESDTSAPSSSDTSSTPIGAVAGTVLGALVFLAVFVTLGLFFLRRRRDKKPGQIGWDGTDFRRHSQRMQIDSFDHPPSTGSGLYPAPLLSAPRPPNADPFSSTTDLGHGANDPFNPVSPSDQTYGSEIEPFTEQSAGPALTSAQRKAAMAGMTAYKPSRFIVHTDAEDVPPVPEEEEVVELPPRYTERRS